MPIRLSGMNSGLDTDAIVTELVKAKSQKKVTLEQDQKKLSWKQDAWKSLNTKIYNFYSKTLSSARLQSDYIKKTTKASSSAVSVVTGSKAPNTVQELEVLKMAKAGYHTGNEVDSSVTADASIKNLLGNDLKWETVDGKAVAKFKYTLGKGDLAETKTVDITEDMTVAQFANALSRSNTGITANFDTKNNRFFINSNEMGDANEFDYKLDDDNTFNVLKKLGLADIKTITSTDEFGNKTPVPTRVVAGTKREASDAEIRLNGAKFTSDKNTFDINGLTITVNNVTSDTITLTTQSDTDGIYDMVKNTIKEYNALINEMDKLYNADSAKKYKMLTDEEKEAMSEDEVKEWEDKIKSALLKGDSTLSTVSSALKSIMLEGIEVKLDNNTTKKMYLSDFGINTAGYFSAADNEKNAYHIDGDSDDSVSATNADKLKAAIASDPETVAKFFAGLSKTLYERLDGLMARTDYSSAFTVYNDKQLTTQYNDYKTKIATAEEKVNKWEDFYYKKFTRMEKAMANMQSAQNALAGLFGGNSN